MQLDLRRCGLDFSQIVSGELNVRDANVLLQTIHFSEASATC